ncbi:hypothetical protein LTR53_015586, partial [Teratosphaeriaceae sp. CCFEE 6253]
MAAAANAVAEAGATPTAAVAGGEVGETSRVAGVGARLEVRSGVGAAGATSGVCEGGAMIAAAVARPKTFRSGQGRRLEVVGAESTCELTLSHLEGSLLIMFSDGQPLPPPSAQITAAENETAKGTRGQMYPIGDHGATVPGRRGYGTKGAEIVLRTNYFALNTAYETNQPEVIWYRYDVDAPGLDKVADKPGFSRDRKR